MAAWMMIWRLSLNQLMWYTALATLGLQCRQANILECNIDLRLLLSSNMAAYSAF